MGQRENSWEDILEEVVQNDQLGAPEKLNNIFIETCTGIESATACQLPGNCVKSVIFPHLVGFHSSRQYIY